MSTIDEMVPEGTEPHASSGGATVSEAPGGDPGRQALLVFGLDKRTGAPAGFVSWVARTVRAARERGALVVFVLPSPPASSPPTPRPPGVHPRLAPGPDDPVFHAGGSSAFAGTELASLLRSRRIERVALAGEPIGGMLLSTAIAANDLGYRVSVLSDACCDNDAAVQRTLLADVLPRYGDVVPTATWLARGARPRARRRAIVSAIAALAVVALLAIGWVVIDNGAGGYYQFSPGNAPLITDSAACRAPRPGADLSLPDGQPCARIEVPAGLSHSMNGSLMMVTVLVGPASPWQYLLNKVGLLGTFQDGTQLIPKGAVLGTTPASLLNCQNAQQMTGASQAAAVVALRRLGYSIPEVNHGALLDEVVPGSPAAAGGLQTTDLVTAVNGTSVTTAAGLQAAIRSRHPGDVVHLTVQRPTGASCSLRPEHLSVTLGTTPSLDGQPAQPNAAFMGVAFETLTTYTLPAGVSVEVGNIGGPSAGLAMSLALLNALSTGDVTGGHKVAATGTIDVNGNVGDVGGVAQKTVAVRRAGAQLFLVPAQEYQTALKEAGPHMTVKAVSTLQQALDDLQAIGGHGPPPSTQPSGAQP